MNNPKLLSYVYLILVAAIVLHIIKKQRDTKAKITWLLVVTLLPVLGIFLYIFLGQKNGLIK